MQSGSEQQAEAAVRHVRQLAARDGVRAGWPEWLPEPVVAALQQTGIAEPWAHQVEAADAAWQGRHVALATGTASGKSLGYLMPVLASTYGGLDPAGPVRPAPTGTAAWRLSGREHTALYLSPTKALAHDQLRACAALQLPGWPVAAVDGDTDLALRDWARDQAAYVFTNPDLLHLSLLPGHARWARFLAALRFVVVDEAHRYRGVFGAQVALVLRRLRRIAAWYGAEPTFVTASATSTGAAVSTAALLGVGVDAVTAVEVDRSARGPVELTLWQPDGDADDATADLLARSVRAGAQTIAFVASRRGAELVARRAQRQLETAPTDATARADQPADQSADQQPAVAAYRGGYLAEDRRRLERDLQEGRLRGVAATNALELGVDIAGLDAVILSGFPGTRSAFWQQAGRAGRRGQSASVTLVGRTHPLDAYLLAHPDALLDAPVEATVLHPEHPQLLAPQLAAAAQELPVAEADTGYFGPATPVLLRRLAAGGSLRQRSEGWYWTRPERAVDSIDLRGSRDGTVEIIEIGTGRILGHVDPAAADRTVHPGAVYLHRGDTYLCEELDLESSEALVRPARPGYVTQPRVHTEVTVLLDQRHRSVARGRLHLGQIAVTTQVTGYLRRDETLGTIWDQTPLELPEHRLQTTAAWLSLDLDDIDAELSLQQVSAGVHAAEHVALGLLPVFAACDRWDVRGHSTSGGPADADTAGSPGPTLYFYDQQPAGAGAAGQAFAAAEAWLAAARDRVATCACEAGCPACIVSADCGEPRRGLDKQAAVALLSLVST